MITPEQKKKLAEIGKQVRELFPNMYGSVRFNLCPTRELTNINITIETSLKLEPAR